MVPEPSVVVASVAAPVRKLIGVRSSIYDRSLARPRGEVSHSAFALLFSELVQYSQNRVSSVSDLERKLEEAGYGIGQRVVELVGSRERLTKRETRVVNMLQYVSNVVWKHLFNKTADNLERSMENEDECELHNRLHTLGTFFTDTKTHTHTHNTHQNHILPLYF